MDVLLALLGHGRPAAGAAGLMALALRAHSGDLLRHRALGSGIQTRCVKALPTLFRARLQQGGIRGRVGPVVRKAAERSAGFPQAQDKSG